MRYAEFGSVSSGTLKTEDLLQAFVNELENQLSRQPRSHRRAEARKLLREAYKFMSERRKTDIDPADLVNELQDALEEFSPPYAYFGAHPGDGADFGYWLSDEIEQDFDGQKVSDLSEVPNGYQGEVLLTNDHGNQSLLVFKAKGKYHEVWSIV